MSSDHSSGAAGLQDLTECPICYERFERPLQLSCGHSYCSKCVDTLRVLSPQSQFGGTNDEYEVGCPECRRVTKVPPGGLPLNYRLQDLIAHVSSEGGEKVNTPRDDAEEKCLLKCLVCNQSMDKGVYMLCRTCAYEHENMVLIESVSEAACHGLDAVYETMNELDAFAIDTKNIIENSTRDILCEFESIASDVQREGIAAQGKLETKIEEARRISTELKKLPRCIKSILTEFRNTIEESANKFAESVKGETELSLKSTSRKGESTKSINDSGNTGLNTPTASRRSSSSPTVSSTTDENAISISTEIPHVKSSAQIHAATRTHTHDDKTPAQSRIPKRTWKQKGGIAVNIHQDSGVKRPDWSGLQSKIKTFLRDVATKPNAANRAVVLTTPAQKGHLLYSCKDECLKNITFGDIEGCQFPGVIARECFNNLWTAWIATDIFSRTDVEMKTKMKWYKDQRWRGLRGDSLKLVLKTAYRHCADWKDFITNTDKANHPAIGGLYFASTYNRVLRELREDLSGEVFRSMPQKFGPIGYIAGVSTQILQEHDVIAGVVITTAATSFTKLVEMLQEWNTYSAWIITWPFDEKVDESTCKNLLVAFKSYMEEGGRVVTAWPAITEVNTVRWQGMTGLWKYLDEAVTQIKPGAQVFITASNKCQNGKVFVEVGSPECSAQYYSSCEDDAIARLTYEAIRNRAKDAHLPCLRTEVH